MQATVTNKTLFKKLVPKLVPTLRKGDCGRIGVIGGSFEYTGAPYYSAYASLKSGADLSHVFCTKGAAIPIKSFSPELIVHPYISTTDDEFDKEKYENIANKEAEKIKDWFSRLSVLVIGPGLGRDELVFKTVTKVIQFARQESLPIVIDADGLYYITKMPDLVQHYSKCILTPNYNEYQRLSSALNCSSLEDLCKKLGVIIVRKGEFDDISNGDWTFQCKVNGSNRRCGGQGDLLSGSIATFYSWALRANAKQSKDNNNNNNDISDNNDNDLILEEEKEFTTAAACYAACTLIRECGFRAFKQHYRGTTAENLLSILPQTFHSLYEEEYEENIV